VKGYQLGANSTPDTAERNEITYPAKFVHFWTAIPLVQQYEFKQKEFQKITERLIKISWKETWVPF